ERQINVYRGMTIEAHGGIADAVFAFEPGPYVSGLVHFFVNALDGQLTSDPLNDALDEFYLNNINVGGILNGTVSADNAWQGLLGPGTLNNMYDHAEDDVSLFMVPYATELRARSIIT